MKKIEEDFIKAGGKYKNYKLFEIFEVSSSNKIFHANDLTIYDNNVYMSYPYVVRSTQNNGIRGFIIENTKYLNPANTLSFAQDTFTAYYQDKPFYTGNKVKILIPKIKFNEKIAIYIVSSLNKTVSNYSWGTNSDVKFIGNLNINLPVKNNEIDFKFMEAFISELEEERISELTAYLTVSGLDNYELSSEDEEILNKKINMKKFSIADDVFYVNNTHNILGSHINPNSGKYPYVTAGENNNSVSTYINYDMNQIEKGNGIMIGGKTLVITYQEKDYFSNDSHNLALYLRDKNKMSENVALYLVSALYKSLKPIYSWGNSISSQKIKKDIVNLPIKDDGAIDYEYMERYIQVIKKLAIKNVVIWKDKIINKTKEII